uniref:Band 7 domain-containing protein n=1 Tax=Pavo cristatus TaxID=9049 RepID=A0A8C9FY01_PAVCR
EQHKSERKEPHVTDRREGIGVCGWILVSVSFLLVLITFPISIWACIKVTAFLAYLIYFMTYSQGQSLNFSSNETLFFTKGKRMIMTLLPCQAILTKDAVTTQVDGVLYYRIHSAVCAVANVNNVHSATFFLAQTTLRNVLGTQTLAQLLAGREEIAHSIQVDLGFTWQAWKLVLGSTESEIISFIFFNNTKKILHGPFSYTSHCSK